MKERERAWNSPRPKLPHVSSSINLRLPSERTRALSQPESPAHLSAGPSLSRQVSGGSLSSSGRADSPGSVHSTQSVENTEMHTEVEHIRERNWNSPQPKWRTSTRSTPSPHSSSTPASAARALRDSYRTDSPRSQSYIDQHSNSNGSALGRSASLPSNNGSSTWAPNGNVQRTKSPSLHLNSERRTPERPVSPSPRQSALAEDAKIPSLGSRFGWSLPALNKTELPPLELDQDTPERPPRPPSQLSSGDRPSLIPVRSPRKTPPASSSVTPSPRKFGIKRWHRKGFPDFAESANTLSADVADAAETPYKNLIQEEMEEVAFGELTCLPCLIMAYLPFCR